MNYVISLVVIMPNITTNHAITYTNFLRRSQRHWLKTDVKIEKKKDRRPQGVAKKVYL